MANGNDSFPGFTPPIIPTRPPAEPPDDITPGGLPRTPPDVGFVPPVVELPFPLETPVPFPIERAGQGISLGRILLGGVFGAVIVKTAATIFEELATQRLDEELRDLEAQLETAKRRRMQREPFARDIVLPPAPQFEEPDRDLIILPRPQTQPAPALPTPTEIEVSPAPIEVPTVPAPQPTLPLPEIAPPTLPAPATTPTPTTLPSPTPAGVPSPLPVPSTRPTVRPLPLPFELPFFSPSPATRPLAPTRPSIPDLTPIEPIVQTSVPTPLALPAASPVPQVASPASQAQRECQEVKRRRRRKGKCREGFFREFPGKTRFTTWREVDCISRQETPFSKARNQAKEAADRILAGLEQRIFE